MSRKVVTMEQKLAAVFADVARGRATVTQVCAELGISRDTYYRYRRRLAADGLAGLQPVPGRRGPARHAPASR
jgi:transposase-like protein